MGKSTIGLPLVVDRILSQFAEKTITFSAKHSSDKAFKASARGQRQNTRCRVCSDIQQAKVVRLWRRKITVVDVRPRHLGPRWMPSEPPERDRRHLRHVPRETNGWTWITGNAFLGLGDPSSGKESLQNFTSLCLRFLETTAASPCHSQVWRPLYSVVPTPTSTSRVSGLRRTLRRIGVAAFRCNARPAADCITSTG